MRNRIINNLKILIALAFIVSLCSFVSAQLYSTPYSYYGGAASYYYTGLSAEDCQKNSGQDFIMQILPGSCSPSIVRSDLLEEQSVPVFCKLTGIKLNPLIETPYIRSVSVGQGVYPQGIETIAFHPYRAALQTTYSQLVGSPTSNDFGYVVVILKKNAVESTMPAEISANLSVRITYDVTTSFGVGKNTLILPKMSDDEWASNYKQYGFWYGKGYVRALDVKDDSATIGIYFDPARPAATVTISNGRPSQLVYLPGTFCSSGMTVSLNSVSNPVKKAVLSIDGDRTEVYEGMKNLIGECTVTSIDSLNYGSNQKVTVLCNSGSYTLEKNRASAKLTIGGSSGDYSIGDSFAIGKNAYYVTFVGKIGSSGMVVLAPNSTKNKDTEIKNINSQISKLLSDGKALSQTSIGSAKIIIGSGTIDNVNIAVNIQGSAEQIYPSILNKYYGLTIDNYKEVSKNWPAAKSGDQVIGENAYLEAIKKAKELGKIEDEVGLINEFIAKYPKSNAVHDEEVERDSIVSGFDMRKASATVSTASKSYFVSLIEIQEPSQNDLNAVVQVNGDEQTLLVKDFIPTSGWVIDDIQDGKIILRKTNPLPTETASSRTLMVGHEEVVDNVKIKLVKTNVKKFASISINPYSREGETYANVSFHVGIEKRAIQLSPEQTKKLITGLDKQIAQWGDVRDRLGDVVEKWKKACLLGTAALWVENFMQNWWNQGEAIARNKIMREQLVLNADGKTFSKGYMEWCGLDENRKSLKDGNIRTVAQCLSRKDSDIGSGVSLITQSIQETNKISENILKDKSLYTQGGLFNLGKQLDGSAFNKKLSDTIKSSNYDLSSLGLGDDSSKVRDLLNGGVGTLLSNGDITQDNAKELVAGMNLIKDCGQSKSEVCMGARQMVSGNLVSYSNLLSAEKTKEESVTAFKGLFGEGISPGMLVSKDKTALKAQVMDGAKLSAQKPDAFKGLNVNGKTFALISVDLNIPLGKQGQENVPSQSKEMKGSYIVEVQNQASGLYALPKASDITILRYDSGNFLQATDDEKSAIVSRISTIEAITVDICDYDFKTKPTVQFWDSGAYKGLPATMPLSPQGGKVFNRKGFYAAIDSSASTIKPGVSTVSGYTEAADPQNFWICNVGKNGEMDHDKVGGDDICQLFSVATYNAQTTFCGLKADETKTLVDRAKNCMKQAATQYGKGNQIQTACGTFQASSKVSTPNAQCEDLMSPFKCNLLYNLCDPVICPPSRCDFGGRYPTDNVIQTGIVGGVFLCLPNWGGGNPFNGGVAVPLCLSGIHAGLDNLITIMKDTRDCLQKSLDTGQTVGICDELKSVYLCELFWKEMTPFIKLGVPSLIENFVYGRKSGGEYLTFASAWENSIQQFQYYTQYYGQNAFKAFQIRTTAEAGSLICRAFVGLRYPNQANLFDEMSKPESPVQYNANFEETTFSSVTVPPISQYKIYWHIYAGKDEPAYWSVYLTDPQLMSTITMSERYEIASGYLGVGETSDVTRDLTAPSGYKQLCVRINLQTKCGFKQVSTGFGLSELANYYVSSQTVPGFNISSSDECTSGKSSLLTGADLPSSLIPLITNPGQGGIEESLTPEIYRRGIVRICSSDNPGKGTDESRWARVGSCDENKKIWCWLDSNSVKGAISDLGLQNLTLEEAAKLQNELLTKDGNYMDQATSSEKMKAAKEISIDLSKINSNSTSDEINAIILPKVRALQQIAQYSLYENYRAEAQALIGQIYGDVTTQLLKVLPAPSGGMGQTSALTSVEAKGTCSGLGWANQFSDIILQSKYAKNIQGSNYDPVLLVAALISQESGGNPIAVSPCGAAGLIQLMPFYSKSQGISVFSGLNSANDACNKANRAVLLGALANKDISTSKTLHGAITTPEMQSSAILIDGRFNPSENMRVALAELVVKQNAVSNRADYERLVKKYCSLDLPNQTKYLAYTDPLEMMLRAYNGLGCGEGADTEYVENVIGKYKACQAASGQNVQEATQNVKDSSKANNKIVTYTTQDGETLQSISNAAYGSSDPAKALARINLMNSNLIKHTSILPIKTTVKIEFTSDEFSSLPTQCSDFSNPIISSAYDFKKSCEDTRMQLDKQKLTATKISCYHSSSSIWSIYDSCSDCSTLKACSEITEQAACENAYCTKQLGSCIWNEAGGLSKCVKVGAADEYKLTIDKVKNENDSLAKIKLLGGFIEKYPTSSEAISSIKLMFDFAEKAQNLSDYAEVAKYRVGGVYDPQIISIANKAMERTTAIEYLNYMKDYYAKCDNDNVQFCQCPAISAANLAVWKARLENYSIMIGQDNGEVYLKMYNIIDQRIVEVDHWYLADYYSSLCQIGNFTMEDLDDASILKYLKANSKSISVEINADTGYSLLVMKNKLCIVNEGTMNPAELNAFKNNVDPC